KLRPAVTDEQRTRKSDPGEPERCRTVYPLHKAFSTPAVVAEVEANCRSAGWGCIDCKKALHASMTAELAPILAGAADLAARPMAVDELLADGGQRARRVARETMAVVRDRMGLDASA
ncbi:MAG: tryptophan--tRNA ligase, partial [Gemmatimonadota bacterium]